MKKAAAILCLLALLFSFAACAPTERTALGFSMGSEYEVTYTCSKDLDVEISNLLSSIEESFSVRVEGSVVARINAALPGEIVSLTQDETDVFTRILTVFTASDGAFDPAIFPLVKAWSFDPPYLMNEEFVPPTEDVISSAKAKSSMSLFSFDLTNNSVSKSDADTALDLGAAIKGYAVEKVVAFLKEKKVKESLIYFGGTIGAVGRDYLIGVTPPRESKHRYAFRFSLKAGEVCATSGDYERYYTYEGKRYHHIIDANTGYPADSGIISATVISSDGLLADALATAVVVLGEEKGIALLEACGAKGALVTSDKKIVTVGVSVTIKDTSYAIK